MVFDAQLVYISHPDDGVLWRASLSRAKMIL